MRVTVRGMSEYQVRTRLYEPPEMVRRLEAKLACWRISRAFWSWVSLPFRDTQ